MNLDILRQRGYEEVDADIAWTGTWVKEIGQFTVQVETQDWNWDSTISDVVGTPVDPPRVQLHLPHECDEWVVANGCDQAAWAQAGSFAENASLAAIEMKALIEEVTPHVSLRERFPVGTRIVDPSEGPGVVDEWQGGSIVRIAYDNGTSSIGRAHDMEVES